MLWRTAQRCESATAALVTVLAEASPAHLDQSALQLAEQAADAAADVLAATATAPAPLRAGGLDAIADLARLLRHDLADHADRMATYANAGTPVPATVTVEVARLRRTTERLVAEVMLTATCDRPRSDGVDHGT